MRPRFLPRRRMGEQTAGIAELSQFCATFFTRGEVFLQRAHVERIERVQCARSQQILIFRVSHQIYQRDLSLSSSRNFIKPDRIRVLTVPRGSPRRLAISVWVSPSK